MTRLVNISKGRLQQVDPKAPVISITDRYSNGVAIPGKDQRPLLQVEFFPRDHAPELGADGCMTAEKAEAIIKFAEEQRDAGAEVIYVQCGEGRIRSFTVCSAIDHLEGFEHDHANSCIKSGIIDRYSFNHLMDEVDTRLRAE
jgi:hypothetical protein